MKQIFSAMLVMAVAIMTTGIDRNNLADTNQIAKSKFNYVIINAPHSTYGYDIYNNDHKLIHQPSIHGLPGMMDLKQKQML